MRHRLLYLTATTALLLAAAVVPISAQALSTPITTDSRIKTLVYNANEVFHITTHYGYQSNIEFGAKETIETISVGDRVAWQISPAGRRLFIRAQEENATTNMTVVTNLRAYQFDLRSSAADAVFGSEELTYVVRFFYPEENGNVIPPHLQAASMPISFAPLPPAAPRAPVSTGTIPAPTTVTAAAPIVPAAPPPPFNYRYTYSGSDSIAPVKIFDDGKSTYFKFAGNVSPQVSVITAKGETLSVPTRRTADGLIAVNAVAPRFSIQQSGQAVLVYNEAGGVL
jgi:type IV secretion system protein VirB9